MRSPTTPTTATTSTTKVPRKTVTIEWEYRRGPDEIPAININLGDTLEFKFGRGYNVNLMPSKDAWDECNYFANTAKESGPIKITPSKAGVHYYASGVPDQCKTYYVKAVVNVNEN